MQDINYFLEDEEQVVKEKRGFFQKIRHNMFKFFCFFVVIMFVRSLNRAWQAKEQRRRYKKIIKKGIFWDTEYLIEKDNE
jgi:hypothetical protein